MENEMNDWDAVDMAVADARESYDETGDLQKSISGLISALKEIDGKNKPLGGLTRPKDQLLDLQPANGE